MKLSKEYKFALPTALGLLLGVLSGSLVFFLILGTVFGLVWGYSDHLLMSSKPVRHTTKKTARKASRKKRK